MSNDSNPWSRQAFEAQQQAAEPIAPAPEPDRVQSSWTQPPASAAPVNQPQVSSPNQPPIPAAPWPPMPSTAAVPPPAQQQFPTPSGQMPYGPPPAAPVPMPPAPMPQWAPQSTGIPPWMDPPPKGNVFLTIIGWILLAGGGLMGLGMMGVAADEGLWSRNPAENVGVAIAIFLTVILPLGLGLLLTSRNARKMAAWRQRHAGQSMVPPQWVRGPVPPAYPQQVPPQQWGPPSQYPAAPGQPAQQWQPPVPQQAPRRPEQPPRPPDMWPS